MASWTFILFFVSFLAFFAIPATAQRYLEVPWSDKTYGPDGPWQAVKITVGGNDPEWKIDAQNHADLDVYPGGIYSTFTFSEEACKPFQDSPCGDGGTWEPDSAATMFAPGWRPSEDDSSFGFRAGPINLTSRALTIAQKTVWNTSIGHTNAGNVTTFDGKTTGLRLGYLALGADEEVHTFTLDPGREDSNVSSNIYNGKLYADQIIGSFSYGLHIGSAAFNYPGSLVFGGYNRGRVIGPMTSFRNHTAVRLLDIGIGVEHGESPFEFGSMQNLLVSDTGVIGESLEVLIDPRTPYLSLPDNTCEGLAKVLPIALDQNTRYYHWKTNDPAYEKIVTSPSYLSFTFPPGFGSSANVTIKVPFALLNLTLDKPVVDKPTPYFPCQSFTPGEGDSYRLGRAFLQAAFIGRNWATKLTWLGQAPGPGANREGLGDEPLDLAADATTLEYWDSEEKNYFNQTWTGHWSVIESIKTTSSNGTDTSPSDDAGQKQQGLTTGTKAGIGVGAAVVGLLVICAAVFFWRRRAKVNSPQSGNAVPSPEKGCQDVQPSPEYFESSKQERVTQSGVAHEMHSASEVQELPDTSDTRPK